MAKKVLFVATVDRHFRAFHLPTFRWFQDQGWEVHVAAQGELDLPHCDRRFRVPFTRQPLSLDNLRAYGQLKAILDGEAYDLVHCHTPVGGALGRLAARAARRRGTKVLYTAHGFHFYTGAPLSHWLLYYPLERWLAGHGDGILTINREDEGRARAFGGPVWRLPGVGVDTDRFRPLEPAAREAGRRALGFGPEAVLLVYPAELNANKNQGLLLEALTHLPVHTHLLLAGDGPCRGAYETQARAWGLEGRVHFMGYRRDLEQVLPLCDVAVASSRREGFGLNLVEGMACGLPVVATANRGHREVLEGADVGRLVPLGPGAAQAFAQAVGQVRSLGAQARQRAEGAFAQGHSLASLRRAYGEIGL